MGKRKERRLAALNNAGRRFKLDLFAEPSGDLGGSSVNNEIGGDIDPTQHTGLPNSPSSSGHQPQNPLLLLGQYSDEELEEESSKMLDNAVVENSQADLIDKGVPLGEGKDVNDHSVDDLTAQRVEQPDMVRDSIPVDVLQGAEGGEAGEIDAIALADTCKEKDAAEQISVAATSNEQVIGDVGSGWRMVMHEESNQYYYWNTETGETSWEIPAVLSQLTQLTSDQMTCVPEYMETARVGANLSTSVGLHDSSVAFLVEGAVGTDLIPQSKELHGNGQMNEWVEGYRNEPLADKHWGADFHQRETNSNLDEVNPFSSDGNGVVSEQTHDALANDHRGIDLPTSLVKQCESLLERLKSLKGCLQCQENYTLEAEIRLSDFKALSTHGSSLLPFWTYSERQLKKLEDVINNEIYQLAVSAQIDDDVKATIDASREKEKSRENLGEESEDVHENSVRSEVSPVSTSVENNSCSEGDYGNVHSSNDPSGSPTRCLKSGNLVNEELNRSVHLNTEFHHGEDIDMDVDMEVEDGEFHASITTADASSAKEFGSTEKLVQPHPFTEDLPLSAGDALIAPPPPEEEWIPPPPPDNDQVPLPPPDGEQVPPPPPDEPPECSYPPLPLYSETGQPLPYTVQYGLTYPDLNLQYYGHTVSVPSSNLYGNTDGSQVALPHSSLYYVAPPNTYTETASAMVSSVDPVAYYNVQDGLVPPVSVVSGVESSQSGIESGPVSHDTLASNLTRTGGDDAAATDQNVKFGGSSVGIETNLASRAVSCTLIATETPLNSVKECVSASSTNAVPAPAAASTVSLGAKVQTKVSRKKRTVAVAPSLRANKKVSSLVDKWKAAKEELTENEENEPQSAYEILEKKRQRVIEEWHAKQIASGDARDNANFQPLGGDWRERVKWRRAQAAKEAAQTPPDVPTDENKEPNLEVLSRGLPPGWQAYWDESSKQAYYGNVITSETTWTKPTK